MNNFEKYYKAVDYLEGLINLPIEKEYLIDQSNLEVYLKRMRCFLNLIGNPDRGMKYIHITGTSGKGSVTNMLHEVLNTAGKKVGSFTSPFVTTHIDKIKVGDKYISPDDFADIVEYLKPFIDQAYLNGKYGRPSYFEILLAIAFVYFKKQKCEYVVLEVGLGGRYDATNVIEKPVVTAITCIDYDHTNILGKTLKKIAYDKAGIIKSGSVFYTSEQRNEIVQMFGKICNEKKVKMIQIPKQENYKKYNELLVITIARDLGIENRHIEKGIDNSKMPCRFEIVQRDPYIVLDGAHNNSKMNSVIENLRELKFRNLHLVIGISGDKDIESILSQVVPLASHIYFTRFQIKERKCSHPKDLLKISKKYLRSNTKVEIFLDPEMAFEKAINASKKEDLVLVAGSFFLAGEIRKRFHSEEWVLKNRKSF